MRLPISPSILPRRSLQVLVGVLSLIPIGAGLAGMVSGTDALGIVPASRDLDSHFRYLSGLLLALGLGFWSTIPDIEAKGARFCLLALLVFMGGLGRLAGLIMAGVPSIGMLGGLLMELVVTPALALWRERLPHPTSGAKPNPDA